MADPTTSQGSNPIFAVVAREAARPFTQYVITIAFAVGMFCHVPGEIMAMAAGLLGWHGWLRSGDKRVGAGGDGAAAQG